MDRLQLLREAQQRRDEALTNLKGITYFPALIWLWLVAIALLFSTGIAK